MSTIITPATGTMRWSAYTLDTYIAPNLSGFNSAVIEDLTASHPEAEHWWANYTLNTIFGGQFTREGMPQAVLGILRHAGGAFSVYHRARRLTLEYVTGTQQGEQPIRKYYAAVSEWEGFVLHMYMAMVLLRWIHEKKLFKKNDGSPQQRIYTIANMIKHLDSAIDSKQLKEGHTIPLWLSNNGLESFGLSVSFGETAALLNDLAEAANLLQNPRALALSPAAETPGTSPSGSSGTQKY